MLICDRNLEFRSLRLVEISTSYLSWSSIAPVM